MKYTSEERLAIGREIYTRQITLNAAAAKYQIDPYTARDYMRSYRTKNNLPPMRESTATQENIIKVDYSNYGNMTRAELIDEIIKAKIETERAKKGYTVKGGGAEKEFLNLNKVNSK